VPEPSSAGGNSAKERVSCCVSATELGQLALTTWMAVFPYLYPAYTATPDGSVIVKVTW
jgi:hypothetical protein